MPLLVLGSHPAMDPLPQTSWLVRNESVLPHRLLLHLRITPLNSLHLSSLISKHLPFPKQILKLL